ncbi:hypothetical protein Cfor_04970 [Coptotermes formosanus]|uniref:WH1 domain-containing protein n=1 Tax=Coptotermes formosanus TaxID=36987 RepID=A0A6L2PLN7_COPFO|nr:hypothetical protein Cfor_04970 [Coptotermes formosanus]
MRAEYEQSGSVLLTRDESEQVYHLLGSRCQCLAAGVVQLFVTDPPDHSTWRRSDAGVLCLVKDNQQRSYFFRLYCLTRCEMVWEHEVYNSMVYQCPKVWLHTFEGEDCIVAFNFAHENDARNIEAVLNQKLEAKKQRRLERRSRSSMQTSHNSVSSGYPVGPGGSVTGSHMGSSTHLANGSLAQSPRQQHRTASGSRRKDKDSKRRLTKADIGLPRDFRHISHVGWDPNKGFDLDNVEDPQLKMFFVKAGVSDSQLQDRETREFIYDFINRHGGMDAVKDEVVYPQAPQPPVGPPPVPARSAPISNFQYQARSAPPPPPSRTNAHPPPPPPPSQPPVVTGPPPPPPPPPAPPMRTPVQRQDVATSQGAPMPPPPPPAMPAVCAPPPPPPPMSLPAVDSNGQSALGVSDPRSALLESIRSGKALKHVEVDSKRPAGVSDSRGELLDQIRQGVELKSAFGMNMMLYKVTLTKTEIEREDGGTEESTVTPSIIQVNEVQTTPRPTVNTPPQDSLAGALARALAERARAIHSETSGSSDDDDDEDDEWED